MDETEEENSRSATVPLTNDKEGREASGSGETKHETSSGTTPKMGNDDVDEVGDEDEVGLHFDADYELEEQTGNILLHPRVATVTYLSDCGAPTLILDQKSPPMDDLKKSTLENVISTAWLSHPQVGKHTAFDGR